MTPDPTKLSDARVRHASLASCRTHRPARAVGPKKRWQERAAVLARFRPSTIDGPPTGEQRPRPTRSGDVLSDTEAMADRGGGANLAGRCPPGCCPAWVGGVEGREAEIKPPEEPLQRMLDAALGGGRIALDQLDRRTLMRFSCHTGSRRRLRFSAARRVPLTIARKTCSGPLTRLTTRFVGREGEWTRLRTYVEEIAAGSP